MRRIASAVLLTLICVSPLRAEIQTKTVTYTESGTELEGFFAWDDSVEGSRPGVLVVHEWWGLNDYARDRARQLAELGYVAFALDMYGKGKRTEHPQQASEWAGQIRANTKGWESRALAGLKILREHDKVDTNRVAAIGYCFGGSTVLRLACSGADLAAVASFHGAPPPLSEELPGKPKASILICHGAADSFITEEALQSLRDKLSQANADWQMIYYAGARHGFTNPNAGEYGLEGLKYDEKADQRSWEVMKDLFSNVLGRGEERR